MSPENDSLKEAHAQSPTLTTPSASRTINVSNSSELTSALGSAQPGDHIVLASGTYGGFSVGRSGTAANPIVVRAASLLTVRITGGVSVSGNHVWIQGLSFQGGAARLSVSGSNGFVVANRFEGWTTNAPALFPGAGGNLTVAYNEFTNPAPFDVSSSYPLRMGIRSSHRGDAHRGAHVHHNYFHNFPDKPAGYHSGQSDAIEVCYTGSDLTSNWLIEYNLIENHRGGSGIIDVKCANGITVQYNTIRNSPAGRLDFRGGAGGPGGRMIANISINSGGFAVHGERHTVIGNVVEGGGALFIPTGDITGTYSSGNTASRQAPRQNTFTCNRANHVLGAWSSGQYNIPATQNTLNAPQSVSRQSENNNTINTSYNCSGIPQPVPLTASQVGPGAFGTVPAGALGTPGAGGEGVAPGGASPAPGGVSGPQTVTCHAIRPGWAVPPEYGAPFSFFSQRLFIQSTNCSIEEVTVAVGDDTSSTIVFNTSYYWNGRAWIEVPLTGSGTSGAWINSTARGSFPALANRMWYVAYICEQSGGSWRCGCMNEVCQQNRWQVQRFSRDALVISGGTAVTTSPTGDTTSGTGSGGLASGVTGERAIPGPNVSGSAQCISGSPTLSSSGIYEGCGNTLGTITISGSDILVRNVNARSITFRNAERSMVTDATLTGGGVFIADSRNVTFEESTVRNVSGRGMDIRPQNTVGVLVRNILFTNISRPNCGGAGTADSGAGIAIGHYYRDSLPSVRPNIIIEGSRFENFPDCGDPISAIHIKSNDTVVRNNVVDARMAGIGVRHGRDNQILNNTTTGQSYGIWVMGDNHQVRGNTANVIRIFAGNMTMDEFDQGNHGGGSVYPVARNIRLSGNSVAPRTQCWGSCPLQPTWTVE